MTVNIQVDIRDISRVLNRAARRVSNLRPLFSQIGEYVVRKTHLKFDEEQDHRGRPWAALSQLTIARKQRNRKRLKRLQEDGDLRRSITYRASNRDVEVGSNRIYAAIQQNGGRAGRNQSVTIEAREYLGVNSEDVGAMTEMTEDYIDVEEQ